MKGLSKEQQALIDKGYKFFINAEGKAEMKETLESVQTLFNDKIQEYNSDYPIEEQKLFAQKVAKAEKVIAGGEDVYISTIAKAKGVSALDVAMFIKGKANAFEIFYAQAEIKRDRAILQL